VTDVVITVRGSAELFHRPERGTVHLQVALDGPSKDQVYGHAVATANALGARIAPLVDEDRGPVTHWSSNQVRSWSDRPWNQAGEQLDPVFRTTVDVRAEFSDLQLLGKWVSEVAPIAGVVVSRVDWALTDPVRDDLITQARRAAVLDARAKAQSYASSLGLGEVRPVAIADAGLLGERGSGRYDLPVAMRASAQAGQAPPVDLLPADIAVSATVEARFHASGG
jgi:hypothetical protein